MQKEERILIAFDFIWKVFSDRNLVALLDPPLKNIIIIIILSLRSCV